MGGRVLDYEAKDILNEGIAKGRTEGRAEEKKAMALSFYKQGVALDVIATVAGVTVEVIENLCKTLAHQVNDTAACISWCIRYPVG